MIAKISIAGSFVLLLASLSGSVLAMPVLGDREAANPIVTEVSQARVEVANVERTGESPRSVEMRPNDAKPAAPTEIGHDAMVAGRQTGELRAAGAAAAATPAVEIDPLQSVLRSLVNVAPPKPETKADGRPDEPRAERRAAAPQRDPLALELDDDLRATVLDVKTVAADLVRATFNPHADENGRIRFSVAGIDGIQLSADGKELSVGVGNTTLGSLSYGASANPGGDPAHAARPVYADENPVRRIIEFVGKIIDHPLTWLLAAIVLLGWLVVAVMSAQAARNSH